MRTQAITINGERSVRIGDEPNFDLSSWQLCFKSAEFIGRGYYPPGRLNTAIWFGAPSQDIAEFAAGLGVGLTRK
jgi:hypothetical protein